MKTAIYFDTPAVEVCPDESLRSTSLLLLRLPSICLGVFLCRERKIKMLEKKITAAQLKELLKNIKTGQIVTATFSGEGVNNYGNIREDTSAADGQQTPDVRRANRKA